MAAPAPRGCLVISFDLDPAATAGGETIAHPGATRELVDLVARHQISATWFSHQPWTCPTLSRVVDRQPRQEIALAADPRWASSHSDGETFRKALRARLDRARAAGYSIATLSLPAGNLAHHADTLRRAGITALRTDGAEGAGRWSHSEFACQGQGLARPVRFGLWEIGTSHRLPATGGWLARWWSARRLDTALTALAEQGGLAHLVVAAHQLASGSSAWRLLVRTLERAQRLADSGQIAILGIGPALAQLSTVRSGQPARSILHRRAA